MNVEGEISGETLISYNKEPVFDFDNIIFEFEDGSAHVEACKRFLSEMDDSAKHELILDKLLRMPEPIIKEALVHGEPFFEKQITKLWSTAKPSWDHEAKVFKLHVWLLEKIRNQDGFYNVKDRFYTVKVRNSSTVGKICEEVKEKFESFLQLGFEYVLRNDGNTLENSKLFSDYYIPDHATLEFQRIKSEPAL